MFEFDMAYSHLEIAKDRKYTIRLETNERWSKEGKDDLRNYSKNSF